MADREITERINVEDGVSKNLRPAVAVVNNLANLLEKVGGSAAGSGPAVQALRSQLDRLGGSAAAPAALAAGLADAGGAAREAAQQIAAVRREAAQLARSENRIAESVEAINARGSAQFQLDRQREVFKLIRQQNEHEHERQMQRLREQARVMGTARHTALGGVVPATSDGGARAKGNLLADLFPGGGRLSTLLSAAGAGSAAGPLAAAAGALGASAAALGVAVAGLSATGVVLSVRATEFRSSTVKSFELLTRSSSEADRIFQLGTRLARELGQAQASTLSSMNTLMARGFKVEGATGAVNVLKAMADLKFISPKAQIDNVIAAIAQIKSKGLLQLEELQGQLGEQFDVGAIIEQIGKKLGKTNDEVRKLITARKIDADTGILAVLDAIREKTGQPLGGAANQQAKTISGMLEMLKGVPQELFDEVDTSPLQSALANVFAFLDSDAGAGLKSSLTTMLSTLFDTLFGSFSGEDGKKRVEELGRGITAFVQETTKLLRSAGPVIRGFFDFFFSLMERLGGGDASKGFYRIADGIGHVISAMVALSVSIAALNPLSSLATIPARIYELFDVVTAALEQAKGLLSSMGIELGGALGSGISQGILGSVGGVVGAVLTMTSAVTGAARGPQGFDSHSPSRVFEKLGNTLPAGIGRGAANDNAAISAVEGMAANATAAAGDQIAAPAGSGAASGGGLMIMVSVAAAPGVTQAEARAQGEAIGAGIASNEDVRRFFRRASEAA
jgi:tape measure domain-containing protein